MIPGSFSKQNQPRRAKRHFGQISTRKVPLLMREPNRSQQTFARIFSIDQLSKGLVGRQDAAIAPRSNQSRFFACADISRLIIAKNKLAHTWDSEWRDRTGFNGHPDLIPAANLLMQREFRRQSCLKIDLFSGDGVVELQKLGMQEISSITREAGEIFKRLAG
jgi:hypothetical protein